MISVRFQGKPCNITVIQVYALTSNAEGAEVGQCHEDLLGFPDSSIGKESACNAGDPSLITGLGRFSGEEIGYLLQYSWASHSSILGLPYGSAGKESACNAGDLRSIPGLGRSPGEGKGYPLQHSGLANSMDCVVHGVAKSQI